ncbi:MAG TPA: DNA methyltransferase [Bacillota bacterium]|nr:DNA methyltransferase [Bacillota bacterium]
MNEFNGQSKDILAENIEKLKALFPEVVAEGKVDFERLQEVLGEYKEKSDERYRFEWNGKGQALRLSQTPSTGTLRPCKEESKDWDTTENLYIEGDNLEVLKLLQKTYHNRIKMIYIDPPYNTGGDFVYKDDFRDNIKNYLEVTGQTDDEGKKLSTNSETSGRYHTDWLNMMYPRLRLARNLLTDDGVIFISIDDNEVDNLKKVCNEVFGEENFIACLVWEKKKKGAFLSKHYINMKEYVLVFAKNSSEFNGLVGEVNSASETYPCIKTTNARGIRIIKKGTVSKYKKATFTIEKGTRVSSGNMELIYLDEATIKDNILENDVRIDSNWIYSQAALDGFAQEGLLYITQDLYIRRIVDGDRIKMLKDLLLRVGSDGQSLSSFKYDVNMNNGGWGTNEDANDELHQLLEQQYLFDFSKPTRLIAKIMQSTSDKSAIVLDFFSGSSTTAHAAMQLNTEDGGNRKFIMVQLPEQTDEKSEAFKAGYKNICEIGKERIRRAGDKIKEEIESQQPRLDEKPKEVPDIGFKVFKLDSSNLKKWNPDYDDIQTTLMDMVDNYVDGRTEEDMLYEIMLKYGIDLTYPIEAESVNGKLVFNIGFGSLFVCLADEIDMSVAKYIADKRDELLPDDEDHKVQRNAVRVVFKDNGFANDSVKSNVEMELERRGFVDVVSV